jgi:hypothetical protein
MHDNPVYRLYDSHTVLACALVGLLDSKPEP